MHAFAAHDRRADADIIICLLDRCARTNRRRRVSSVSTLSARIGLGSGSASGSSRADSGFPSRRRTLAWASS